MWAACPSPAHPGCREHQKHFLHSPFLESLRGGREMDRFLGIRDVVPGTYPHPTGQDLLAREHFPFTSPFHLQRVSPEPHRKNELGKNLQKQRKWWGTLGRVFPPLAGWTIPNTLWGGCSEPRTRCLWLASGQGLPRRFHGFCALKQQSMRSPRYFFLFFLPVGCSWLFKHLLCAWRGMERCPPAPTSVFEGDTVVTCLSASCLAARVPRSIPCS